MKKIIIIVLTILLATLLVSSQDKTRGKIPVKSKTKTETVTKIDTTAKTANSKLSLDTIMFQQKKLDSLLLKRKK